MKSHFRVTEEGESDNFLTCVTSFMDGCIDNENRRNSVGSLLGGTQPPNQVLYKFLDIPNWSSIDQQQNSDIETILKMLFSPRNSHFHRDYRSRAGTPRGSLEASSRSGVNHFKIFGEMYHSQRRNTLGALGIIRGESFQLQILRDQVISYNHKNQWARTDI